MEWLVRFPRPQFAQALVVLASCYFLGCVVLGYYLARMATGQDIRKLGSGSVGAKNVGRAIGSWGFAVTLAGDMGKGALAVWATERASSSDSLKYLAMLAVVTGHIWPVQLRFHGGKGMATATGTLIALNPWMMAGLVAAFVPLLGLLRNTALAGLAAFALLPFLSGLLGNPALNTIGFALLSVLVLFAHRENIRDELAALAATRKSKARSNRSHEKAL